jgi:hypothetical protein
VSTPLDMAECEARDCFGMPPMAAGRDNNSNLVSGASVLMIDSSRLLPLVMMACFLAGAGLLSAVMVAWLLPPRIAAEMRAEFAQDIADARAEARAAGTDATLWKNRVMRLEAQADADRRR